MSRTSALVVLLLLAACTDMKDQPRVEPLEASRFFADGRSARLPVEGTVARGQLRVDDHLHRGLGSDGQFVRTLPMELDARLLARGRERYDIFCSPCHDRSGEGLGMIVRRGYKRPPSFHEQRLRQSPVGYFYDVITNGFGDMSGYAAQIPVEDRWAIVAHLRTLQLRRDARLDELPADLAERLRAGETVSTQVEEVEHGDAGH